MQRNNSDRSKLSTYWRTRTEILKFSILARTYDVKNTTEKPIQLATTPIAE